MRTFDGTGEYVRADELATGDEVRCADGVYRPVVTIETNGSSLVVLCADGFGWSAPAETRYIRRIAGA